MPIRLTCPGCNRTIRVKDELAGKRVKCPACGTHVEAAAAVDSQSPPARRQPQVLKAIFFFSDTSPSLAVAQQVYGALAAGSPAISFPAASQAHLAVKRIGKVTQWIEDMKGGSAEAGYLYRAMMLSAALQRSEEQSFNHSCNLWLVHTMEKVLRSEFGFDRRRDGCRVVYGILDRCYYAVILDQEIDPGQCIFNTYSGETLAELFSLLDADSGAAETALPPQRPKRRLLVPLAVVGAVCAAAAAAWLFWPAGQRRVGPGIGAPVELVAPEMPAAKSTYNIRDIFRLEQVSVMAKATVFGGQELWTFVPTLRIHPTGTDAPSPAASDLWVWIVYMSGSPADSDIADIMLRHPPWTGDPPNGMIALFDMAPSVDGKRFRFGRLPLSFEPRNGHSPIDADAAFYSMLLAPDAPEQRWSTPQCTEITFFIQGYDDLGAITLGRRNAPPPRGVALVCLCGFEPEFAVFSAPLVLRLDGPAATVRIDDSP